MRSRLPLCFLALSLFVLSGWDYSKHSVPLEEIKHGGPVKDGIPALMYPRFAVAGSPKTHFLKPDDRVIGVAAGGKFKAYPIKILNWHEVVNDRIAGKLIVVTFCPLCGTGMVFDAHEGKTKRSFGVSGLLYQSDMLLYDHQTESLWSQIKSEAIAGSLTGQRLSLLPSTHTSWKAWRDLHPDTVVITRETGYQRPYSRNPYGGYENSREIYFKVSGKNLDYHPKEKVIGIVRGMAKKVYPFSELARSPSPLIDRVGKTPVQVTYNHESGTASIHDDKGQLLPSITGYWFAWYTFHPKAEVYQAGKQ